MYMRKLAVSLFIVSVVTAIYLYGGESTYKCKFRRNFMNIERIEFYQPVKLSHTFQDVDSKCRVVLDSYNDMGNQERSLGYWYSYHGWE